MACLPCAALALTGTGASVSGIASVTSKMSRTKMILALIAVLLGFFALFLYLYRDTLRKKCGVTCGIPNYETEDETT